MSAADSSRSSNEAGHGALAPHFERDLFDALDVGLVRVHDLVLPAPALKLPPRNRLGHRRPAGVPGADEQEIVGRGERAFAVAVGPCYWRFGL